MLSYLLGSVNANLSPVITGRLEFNHALNESKKGMVFTHAHIIARVNASAALPNQYRPGMYLLSSVSLYPEPLGLTVPTVTSAAASLFMFHLRSPLSFAGEPSWSARLTPPLARLFSL